MAGEQAGADCKRGGGYLGKSKELVDVARVWWEAREVELVVQGAHFPLTAGENCTHRCGGVSFVL